MSSSFSDRKYIPDLSVSQCKTVSNFEELEVWILIFLN